MMENIALMDSGAFLLMLIEVYIVASIGSALLVLSACALDIFIIQKWEDKCSRQKN